MLFIFFYLPTVLELRKRSLMYIRLYRYGRDLLDRKKSLQTHQQVGSENTGIKGNDKDLPYQEESTYGGSHWENVLRGIDC